MREPPPLLFEQLLSGVLDFVQKVTGDRRIRATWEDCQASIDIKVRLRSSDNSWLNFKEAGVQRECTKLDKLSNFEKCSRGNIGI